MDMLGGMLNQAAGGKKKAGGSNPLGDIAGNLLGGASGSGGGGLGDLLGGALKQGGLDSMVNSENVNEALQHTMIMQGVEKFDIIGKVLDMTHLKSFIGKDTATNMFGMLLKSGKFSLLGKLLGGQKDKLGEDKVKEAEAEAEKAGKKDELEAAMKEASC